MIRDNFVLFYKITTTLIFCGFLLFSEKLFASPLTLDRTTQGLDISKSSAYFCSEEPISFEKAINGDFKLWQGKMINFGYTTSHCWIRVSIHNLETQPSQYFFISRFSLVDHLDIYYKKNGNPKVILLGDDHTLSDRDFATTKQVGSITLEPLEELDLFIYARTDNTLVIPISIYSEKNFIEFLSRSEWLDGTFYGILFGLMILSILFYWYFKDVAYLTYFAHVVSMMLMFFNMDGKTILLWPQYPQIIDYAHMLFTYFALITGLLFAKHYLLLNETKNLFKLNQYVTYATASLILVSPLVPEYYSNMGTSFVSIIVALILLYTAIERLRDGLVEARYYCVGWGIILVTTMLMSSSIIGTRFEIDTMLLLVKYSFALQQMIIGLGLSSRIRQLQLKEEQAREDAIISEMKFTARNEFFAKMSHEIRTPINGVSGCLQLVNQDNLTPEQKDYINTAKNSADILLCVVNDILDFSKFEAGKLKLEERPFEITPLVHDCIRLFEIQAQKKALEFTIDIDKNIPGLLYGDPTRIQQVLLNLVSNAIKFTDNGEIKVACRVKSTSPKVNLEFKVSDTGIGIAPKDFDTLFEPFEQINSKHQSSGTGLGLAICKQICEAMGGGIFAESRPGLGTTFTFNILAEGLNASPYKSPSSQSKEDEENKKQIRVLYAEDNPTNAKVLEGILGNLNMHHTATHDGAELITFYTQRPDEFDIILMDCEMPNMDGYEAASFIRKFEQQAELPAIPIIALTAHASDESSKKCMAAGMNEHLAKPINVEILSTIIYSLIDQAS